MAADVMAEATTELGPLSETVVFLNHLRDCSIRLTPASCFIRCPPAALAGSETFVDITRFRPRRSSVFCVGASLARAAVLARHR
jgi:hypothetical protein